MAEEKVCPHCLHDHKDRSDTEKKKLMNRLSRIEGQVRGLKGMVENDAYCPEILTQAAAANAALNAFSR
ncbi:MAG: metal-sensing transcriptional repressor, partial [Clostridia bacterium]|nr:metal-sensing transcriptional repressor [Clostridia bacterium]